MSRKPVAIHQLEPDIAASPFRVLIVWQGLDRNGLGIRGQLYDAQLKKIDSEFPVNTEWITGQLFPRVIALDSLFITAWNSERLGEKDDVYVRAFTHDGGPLGPEIRVNEFTSGHQRRPCLTTVERGFAVAWQDEKRDGIFARIFSEIKPTSLTTITSLHMPALTVSMGGSFISLISLPQPTDLTGVYAAIIAALAFCLCGSIGLHFYRSRKTDSGTDPGHLDDEYTSARVEASVDSGHYQSSLPIQQPSTPANYNAWGVVEEENAWRQQHAQYDDITG